MPQFRSNVYLISLGRPLHVISIVVLLVLLLLIAASTGCRPAAPLVERSVASTDSFQQDNKLLPLTGGSRAEEYPHLHNLMQLTGRIYTGGEPHGEAAFEELARLGVTTVVSVDGARPQVELAQRHGLRYVHIPISYDGVSDEAGRSLAQLMIECEGPLYIHCHHGKHRGPAAAAIACIASGAADGQQAQTILQRAGTSPNYAGLWRDVENYQPPAPGEALPKLVAVAQVGDMAAAMAQIDRAKDNLSLCQAAQWSVPDDHPDLVAAEEALVLREALHETGRHLSEDRPQAFIALLVESEAIAGDLEHAIVDRRHAAAGNHFERLLKSCKECHIKYRD